ncbi:MAG: hypothetical protein WCA07_08165 [Gloeobacterales cyanobacterium]
MNRTSKRTRPLAKAGKPGKFRVSLDMGSIKGLLFLAAMVAALGGALWFMQFGTIRGVPVSVVLQFLRDDTARKAYFSGDKQQLHDRLDRMGVEEEVKAFYRPKIQDEAELDRYIHQLLYNITGYVGLAYEVDAKGSLAPKKVRDPAFEQWFQLAYQAGIVVGSREEAGVQYVISPDGNVVPYKQASSLFPLETLKMMINQK